MTAALSTGERIGTLLDDLGIDRAHVAGCLSGDWGELVDRWPQRLRSLTVVAPHLNKGTPAGIVSLSAPMLVIAGERGAPGERARTLAARHRDARLVKLAGYESPMWADTVADWPDVVAEALLGFLAEADTRDPAEPLTLPPGEGEIAGLHYRTRGAGPPLLLLPLSLAPSQWRPVEARLAERYCTITLGGARLGAVALIEDRAASGYGDLVASLLALAAPQAGEVVLEVGCGSGPLARALALRTAGRVEIVAADLNAHLLSEARRLAAGADHADAIRFVEANGEALGFADAAFDVVYCCTVLEEGDADRMIEEMVRVLRPGGRLVAVTRCVDVDWWANIDVPDAVRRRVGSIGPAAGSGLGAGGCADASLYGRLRRQGLDLRYMGPQFAMYRPGRRLDDVLDRLLAPLANDERALCGDAIARGSADGTLFVAEPFHCAVAVKPAC